MGAWLPWNACPSCELCNPDGFPPGTGSAEQPGQPGAASTCAGRVCSKSLLWVAQAVETPGIPQIPALGRSRLWRSPRDSPKSSRSLGMALGFGDPPGFPQIPAPGGSRLCGAPRVTSNPPDPWGWLQAVGILQGFPKSLLQVGPGCGEPPGFVPDPWGWIQALGNPQACLKSLEMAPGSGKGLPPIPGDGSRLWGAPRVCPSPCSWLVQTLGSPQGSGSRRRSRGAPALWPGRKRRNVAGTAGCSVCPRQGQFKCKRSCTEIFQIFTE